MFGLLFFLEIAYEDSLQQCLTSSRGKTHEKHLEPKFGPKGPKSGLKLVSFRHILKYGSLVFLEISYNDSLQQCILSSRVKIHENKFCGSNFSALARKSKFRPFSQIGRTC